MSMWRYLCMHKSCTCDIFEYTQARAVAAFLVIPVWQALSSWSSTFGAHVCILYYLKRQAKPLKTWWHAKLDQISSLENIHVLQRQCSVRCRVLLATWTQCELAATLQRYIYIYIYHVYAISYSQTSREQLCMPLNREW